MVTEPYHPGGPPGMSPGGPPRGPGPAPDRSRRGQRTMIVGTILIVASVIIGVTSVVVVGTSMGRPLYETMTNPARATPVDEKLTLRAGRYAVFGLTEPTTDAGDTAEITAKDVKVTGPDGKAVVTSNFGSLSEDLTRSEGVYTGAVRFTTPVDGEYRVRVSTKNAQVVIAPALGSGFSAVLGWLIAGFLSGLTFLLGVVLLIVGAVRRRRSKRQPAPDPAAPAKGWYPAPDVEGKQRYWDGQTWTQYLR
jgi:hypothetical protein